MKEKLKIVMDLLPKYKHINTHIKLISFEIQTWEAHNQLNKFSKNSPHRKRIINTHLLKASHYRNLRKTRQKSYHDPALLHRYQTQEVLNLV